MNAWMYVAGWVLVHFVWQGAVVASLAALILRCAVHRRSASCATLIACGAMRRDAASVHRHHCRARRSATLPMSSQRARPCAPTPNGRVDVSPADSDQRCPFLAAVSNAAARRGPSAVDCFGLVVRRHSCCSRARRAGWWRVRRLHQLALASMCSSWQAAGNRIASRLGLASVIRIVELPHIDVPLVVGCLRPIVRASDCGAVAAQRGAGRGDPRARARPRSTPRLPRQPDADARRDAAVLSPRPSGGCRRASATSASIAATMWRWRCAAILSVMRRRSTELEAWRSGELSLAAAATGGSLLNRVRRILRVDVSEDSRPSSWTLGLVVAATVAGRRCQCHRAGAGATEPRPKFEVASVRLNTSGDNKVIMRDAAGWPHSRP